MKCNARGTTKIIVSLLAALIIAFPTGALTRAHGSTGLVPIPLSTPDHGFFVHGVRLDLQDDRLRYSTTGSWVSVPYLAQPENLDATDSLWFTNTGVPFRVPSRRKTRLLDLRNGKTIELAPPGGSAWAASWSPDGRRLAYYSDDGGAAGIWIWDSVSQHSRKIHHVTPRPFWTSEIYWTPDGRKILTKLLPEGMTIAAANALNPKGGAKPRFPTPSNDVAMVAVERFPPEGEGDARFTRVPPNVLYSDLATVDVSNGEVLRFVIREDVASYKMSPDGRYIAYAVWRLVENASSNKLFDFHVFDLETKTDRVLQASANFSSGWNYNWSPDSKSIAYIATDGYAVSSAIGELSGSRRVTVLEINGGRVDFEGNVGLGSGSGTELPYWDSMSQSVYVVGSGKLWRLDPRTKSVAQTLAFSDISIHGLSIVSDQRTGAIAEFGGQLLLKGFDSTKGTPIVLTVSPKLTHWELIDVGGSVAHVSRAGTITYYDNELGVWSFDIRKGVRRRLLAIIELPSYPAAESRRIKWQSNSGQALYGILELPPNYKAGTRLPVIVNVYGGTDSAAAATDRKRTPQNLFTSRGYGVFTPDIPIRVGTAMDDIYSAVISGVDAIVEQGYADPNRLAVKGASYGSYTVFCLLVQTNRFRAAISTENVHPNLFEGYLKNPQIYEIGQFHLLGTPWTQQARYFKNSPFFYLDKITTPLLLAQGEDDIAMGDGAEVMFLALKKLGRQVELRRYQHEGHGFVRRANVIDWNKRQLEFLREHLGSEGILSS